MGISVASLIAQTRVDSGLRNNRLFSDDMIADKLTDAYADLRDKMIARFAYWFRGTYDFSLTNGEGNNFLDLTLVPDLEMIQGVFLLDSAGNPYPVDLMSSISEVNQLNSTFMFNVGFSFNGFLGRKYFPDGDFIFIYPSANASGNYRLIYTPQPKRLSLPKTVNFTIASGDIPEVPPPGGLPGTGAWLLANANLAGATDIPTAGFDLSLTFTTTNLSFSGAYHVVGLGLPSGGFGQPTFGVSNLASVAGFSSPPTGTGTYTYQPVGTVGTLPDSLTQWAKYLTLYASRVIRTSRRQRTGDIDLQFQQIEKRLISITKQRTEGVRQAPLTHTNYGVGGGFGNGI